MDNKEDNMSEETLSSKERYIPRDKSRLKSIEIVEKSDCNNERIIKIICEVYMDKIKISGFEYIGSELSFIVHKDLWRI